jgi:hypothetical protein
MALEYLQKFPDQLPSALPVYRLREPLRFPEASTYLSDLARQLGLDGKAEETSFSRDWTTHYEGPYELSLHALSWALVYRHREKYAKQGERPFAMSDEEAEAITRGFLERSGLVPIDQIRVLRVTHLRTAGGDVTGGAREELLLDAGVIHGRQLESVPVDGPGGNALVNVDPEGEVVGARVVWRPLADVAGEVEIRPPDHAYAAMEAVAGRMRGDVTVTKATFGYFEQGVMDRQEYLQPAYALIYVVQNQEVTHKSAMVVPGSEKLFELLEGSKRFPTPPQEPR